MPDTNEVTRAVKEALSDKALQDLSGQLTTLSNEMHAGFARVTTRQDVANGKLMKHDIALEKQSAEAVAKLSFDKLLWLALTTLVSLTVGLGTYLITR